MSCKEKIGHVMNEFSIYGGVGTAQSRDRESFLNQTMVQRVQQTSDVC